MTDTLTFEATSTFEKMLTFLAQGKDIDLTTFNTVGRKTLKQLFEEVERGEATLIYNPSTGRMERHARSVKILIVNHEHGVYWVEMGRSSTNPPYKQEERPWSLSETMKTGETPLKAAVRGIFEELKIPVPEDQIRMIPNHESTGTLRFVDTHESSAYPGILSIVETFYVEWHTHILLPQEAFVITDDRIHVLVRPYPFD